MKTISALLITLSLLVGCATANRYSSADKTIFSEGPYIVHRSLGSYALQWRYGTMGFYYFPTYKIVNDQVVFALDVTSSSGAREGKIGEIAISDRRAIQPIRAGEAYWLEPSGQKTKLEIRNE